MCIPPSSKYFRVLVCMLVKQKQVIHSRSHMLSAALLRGYHVRIYSIPKQHCFEKKDGPYMPARSAEVWRSQRLAFVMCVHSRDSNLPNAIRIFTHRSWNDGYWLYRCVTVRRFSVFSHARQVGGNNYNSKCWTRTRTKGPCSTTNAFVPAGRVGLNFHSTFLLASSIVDLEVAPAECAYCTRSGV